MSARPEIDRSHLREPGSVILSEFRAAMQARRAGAQFPSASRPGTAAMARSFQASESNAFTGGWGTWSASINALLRGALAPLVSRSRQWSRNTGAGRRFGQLVRNGVVGPQGIALQMACGDWRQEKGAWVFRQDKLANDAIERAWLEWCKPGNCDASGKFSFADACKLQIEQVARDGELLARHLRGTKACKWRYQVQLLSTDRLDVNHNELAPGGGPDVQMGVHRESTGRPLAYSILRYHPGDSRGTHVAEIVTADQIMHGFIAIDPEQARGVPWSHAILIGSNMLAQFQNFAVFAAQVGASQMGFFTQPAEALTPMTPADLGAKEDGTTGQLSKEMAPGALDLLPPGIDFKPFVGQYPTDAYGPFVAEVKHDIASGLGVAYHNLTGDMTKVNYSSARIAELAERDNWRGLSHWFVGAFVEPVFRAWLEMALLSGQITLGNGQALPVAKLDKYLAGLTFTGRGWDWVDPLKEVTAAKVAVEQGFATRTQVVAAKGGDFEDNVRQIAAEKEILDANGVTLGPLATPADVAAAAMAYTNSN